MGRHRCTPALAPADAVPDEPALRHPEDCFRHHRAMQQQRQRDRPSNASVGSFKNMSIGTAVLTGPTTLGFSAGKARRTDAASTPCCDPAPERQDAAFAQVTHFFPAVQGTRAAKRRAATHQNFSFHGRNATSHVQALRGCCNTCQ